jgi:hypothetical protein
LEQGAFEYNAIAVASPAVFPDMVLLITDIQPELAIPPP